MTSGDLSSLVSVSVPDGDGGNSSRFSTTSPCLSALLAAGGEAYRKDTLKFPCIIISYFDNTKPALLSLRST